MTLRTFRSSSLAAPNSSSKCCCKWLVLSMAMQSHKGCASSIRSRFLSASSLTSHSSWNWEIWIYSDLLSNTPEANSINSFLETIQIWSSLFILLCLDTLEIVWLICSNMFQWFRMFVWTSWLAGQTSFWKPSSCFQVFPWSACPFRTLEFWAPSASCSRHSRRSCCASCRKSCSSWPQKSSANAIRHWKFVHTLDYYDSYEKHLSCLFAISDPSYRFWRMLRYEGWSSQVHGRLTVVETEELHPETTWVSTSRAMYRVYDTPSLHP